MPLAVSGATPGAGDIHTRDHGHTVSSDDGTTRRIGHKAADTSTGTGLHTIRKVHCLHLHYLSHDTWL